VNHLKLTKIGGSCSELVFCCISAVIFTSLPQVPELENLYNNFMRQMSVLSGMYLVYVNQHDFVSNIQTPSRS
jgi:hypothetical protein